MNDDPGDHLYGPPLALSVRLDYSKSGEPDTSPSRLTEGHYAYQRYLVTMNLRVRNSGFARRLGLMLGCAALLLPPSIGSYLPVAATATQPMEEEESRSPVETTKIAVGAVHRQQDRRERPQVVVVSHCLPERPGRPSAKHGLSVCIVFHAMDLHNGLGGPLIV